MYAKTLRPGRVAANLLTGMALPGGTDSISIPQITTGTDVAVQTADNAATQSTDMLTTSVTAPVRTISGYETVSLQLLEQSPLQNGLDRMVFADLMQALDYKLDYSVIQGVGTAGDMYGLINTSGISAGTYTSGTPTAAGIGTAIIQGISTVAKNRYRGAEAILMHPSIWYFLVGSADTSGRPLVVPTANGPWNSQGVVDRPGEAQGFAGTFMGLPVYVSASIATVSSQLPVVVAAFTDTVLFESGPRTRVIIGDTAATNLSIRFQLYSYSAIAARYPAGIHKIVGTGLVPTAGY